MSTVPPFRNGAIDANTFANGKSMDKNGDGKVDSFEYLFHNAGNITGRFKDLIGRTGNSFFDSFVNLSELKEDIKMSNQEVYAAADKILQEFKDSTDTINTEEFGILGSEIDTNNDNKVEANEFYQHLLGYSVDENGNISKEKINSFHKNIK